MRTLRTLERGWYEPSTPAFSGVGLDWLEALLTRFVDDLGLPLPHIYPTPEGKPRAEWSTSTAEVVLTIDPARRCVEGVAVRIDPPGEHALHVTVTDSEGEERVRRFLDEHLGTSEPERPASPGEP